MSIYEPLESNDASRRVLQLRSPVTMEVTGELVCANWGAVNSVEELNGKNQTYTHFSIFALSQFFENLAAHHIDVVILFWLQ